MNVAIDPQSGTPRWEVSRAKHGPKEDFAYEAAIRLLNGTLTLDILREQMIAAANAAWKQTGGKGELHTLNDVKSALGGSAKDWFHEIRKVSSSPEALSKLIDQEGKGLTAISRSIEPLQAQRAKGFSNLKPSQRLKPLLDVLGQLRSQLDSRPDQELTQATLHEVGSDLQKYSALLKQARGRSDR